METAMKLSLFEVAAEYRAAVEKLSDLDLDDQTLADTLESLPGELEVKAKNVAMFARDLEATAASIKDAEAQMAARRKAIENRAAGVRRYILSSMQLAGMTKIECPHFALTVKNNPPAVEIYEPLSVPAAFMKQPEPPPPSPDKTAIKEAIKRGEEVPGCRMTQGKRLDIA
jgi:hypothetical protein